jgi:hypothetical protein
MLHVESLSGSLALLLWCSSDENGELTHIEFFLAESPQRTQLKTDRSGAGEGQMPHEHRSL